MKCKICLNETENYCRAKTLGKYDVQYYKCSLCKFIFTEEPYWLGEAYSNAITKLDIGLIARNEYITPIVKAIIEKWFNPNAKYVDYGGGYGMLVRMMRDRGYDFYRQDMYCENIYAESFDVTDYPIFKAEFLTAFEVFEHLVDPVMELEKMLTFSDTIVFTTSIQPNNNVKPESWWYFIPETGQHISLYSRESLQKLANKFGLNYYWNEFNLHMFTNKKIKPKLFKVLTNPHWINWYNKFKGSRNTLLDKDFSLIRNSLNGK